jgi:hypothetical protein
MARSPNYPGVDLKFAVERAQKLWDTQQAHTSAPEVAMKNLGYTLRSGAGSVTYAALKRFGLLREDENKRAGLTPLGVEIVRGESTGQRNYEKIREAALTPSLHKTMWEQYGADLPDDSVLQFDLVQKSFTTKGADEFLGQWKRTMTFAKLAEASGTVSTEASENGSENEPENMTTLETPPKPPVAKGSRHYPIPLRDGDAALTVPEEMDDAAWTQMLAVLEAMKPGIVRPAPDDD